MRPRLFFIVQSWFFIALIAACGYRPVATAPLPGGVRSVLVELAQVGRAAEPALAPLLASELVGQLSRRGVAAFTLRKSNAEAHLRCRVVSLGQGIVPVVNPELRTLAADDLVLRWELHLVRAADGETLWRSGLLEVSQLQPRNSESAAADQAVRAEVIRRLAAQGASVAVEGMVTGL